MASSPRTLVVFCPDWPVTASGRPAGEPVAVVAAQRVVAVSAAARAHGVRGGQRRREAQAACPALTLLAADPGQELRAFEPVLEALERFGAPVSAGRPGWAAFPTRGPARYHGGERALAGAVGVALATLLPPGSWRVGVADGPFAATLAAQTGAGPPPADPVSVVPSGATASFLAPLAIEMVGQPELADLLRRLGVRTLGAFAALAEEDVLARFGTEGARAHRLAGGRDDERLRGRKLPPDLAVSSALDPPAERVDQVAFVAKTLAVSLGERLSGHGLACTQLAVEVSTSEGAEFRRVWGQDGAWSPSLVAERVRWQLEAWLLDARGRLGDDFEATPAAGVEAVRLLPVECTPDHGCQLGFWSRPPGQDERALRVVARVQGMLGSEAVLQPVLTGGRSPGDGVVLVPFGDPLPASTVPAGTAPRRRASPAIGPTLPPAPWPGRLPPPSPAVTGATARRQVELLDGAGAVVRVDGRGLLSAMPARILGSRSLAAVARWAGPWPVEERWWDRGSRRRRARLQVLLESGEAYLLSLEGGNWWVEAVYD